MIFLLVIAATLFVVMGQVLLKSALTEITTSSGESFSFFQQLWMMLPTRYFIGAVISLTIAGLMWVYALKQYELSLVYPLTSLSYLFMMGASHFFLNEKITTQKILGVLVIVMGIIVLSWRIND